MFAAASSSSGGARNLCRWSAASSKASAYTRKEATQSVVIGYSAAYALPVHENMEQSSGIKRPSGLGVYWGRTANQSFWKGHSVTGEPTFWKLLHLTLRANQGVKLWSVCWARSRLCVGQRSHPGHPGQKLKFNDEVIDISSGEGRRQKGAPGRQRTGQRGDHGLGVTKSKVLRDCWAAGLSTGGQGRQKSLSVTWPDGSTLTGTFQLSSYNEDAGFKDAATFEATLLSASTDLAYTPERNA